MAAWSNPAVAFPRPPQPPWFKQQLPTFCARHLAAPCQVEDCRIIGLGDLAFQQELWAGVLAGGAKLAFSSGKGGKFQGPEHRLRRDSDPAMGLHYLISWQSYILSYCML